MTQRFTLDRSSFEQFLAAASLLQQFQKRSSTERQDAQPLWTIIDLQRDIEAGRVDLETVVQRIPQLAWQLVGGSGAAVWLLTEDNEFTWRAGTGAAASDERLRLEVLSRLAEFDDDTHDASSASRNWDAGYYPGCAKSLLVEPIRQGQGIAGAIAVFATEFDAFTDRDISKVRLVGSLLGYALDRSSSAAVQRALPVQRATLQEAISRVIPQLEVLAHKQEAERQRPSHILRYQAMYSASQSGAREDEPWLASAREAETAVPSMEHSPSAPVDVPQTLEAAAVTPSSQEPLIQHGETEDRPGVADIYVPGIGVRAALGGDEERQPSRIWSNLGRGLAGVGAVVIAAFAAIWHGLVFVVRSLVRVVRTTGAHVRSAARFRPKLPTLPIRAISSGIERTVSRCTTGLASAGSHMRIAASRLPRPSLPTKAAQRAISSAGASTGKSLRTVGRALREAPNVIPDLPTIPTDRIGSKVSSAGSALLAGLMDIGNLIGNAISGLRPRGGWSWRIEPRVIRRGAPAVVVLSVMLAFLFSEAGLHKTQVASANSGAAVTPAAAVLPIAKITTAEKSPVTALAHSPTHHQVTDAEVRSEIENMTRYELATVRRAAQYGDDAAQFQLGMAYEIGYGMTQNCAKAAEWVTRAANEGNAAAEYNLGLRYRDGDGVAANPSEAESWLKKAAQHKYGNAKAVVASLNGGQ